MSQLPDKARKRGVTVRVVDQSSPSLVAGGDLYVTTQLVFSGTCEPYALSGFTGASAYFGSTGGSPVVSIGVLESADLGTVRFDVPASGSIALLPGDPVSFQQDTVDGRGLSINVVEDALTIVASLF